MGTWIVGEYTNPDNGEILDVLGPEEGQEGILRVIWYYGQDVMPQAELDANYELTVRDADEWEELSWEAEDEGPEVFAHFQMIRARHAA